MIPPHHKILTMNSMIIQNRLMQKQANDGLSEEMDLVNQLQRLDYHQAGSDIIITVRHYLDMIECYFLGMTRIVLVCSVNETSEMFACDTPSPSLVYKPFHTYTILYTIYYLYFLNLRIEVNHS